LEKLSWQSLTSGVLSIGCPACVPAIGGALTSVGLGAFTSMTVMRPLAGLFLALGLWAFYANYRRHHQRAIWGVASISAIGVFSFRYVIEQIPLMWISFIVLIGMAFADYQAAKMTGCMECSIPDSSGKGPNYGMKKKVGIQKRKIKNHQTS